MHTSDQRILITAFVSFFLLTPSVWGIDAYAERKIRLAAMECEHALNVQPPKTEIALRVLQRYFQKYSLYRDAAVARDPDLWISEEQHPTGKRFLDKSYQAILSLCERELPKKLEQAAQDFARYQERQKNAAQQQQALHQQQQTKALQQVKQAVGHYCQNYSRLPVQSELSDSAKLQLNNDYAAYTQARKAALGLYADIEQDNFAGLLKTQDQAALQPKTQSVREWFEYCELVFADHLSKTVEAEGPPVPNAPVNKAELAPAKPVQTAEAAPTKRVEGADETKGEVATDKSTSTASNASTAAALVKPAKPVAVPANTPESKPVDKQQPSTPPIATAAAQPPAPISQMPEKSPAKVPTPTPAAVKPKPEAPPTPPAQAKPEVVKPAEKAPADTADTAAGVADTGDVGDTGDAGDEEDDYQLALKKAKADRLKILKKEKRAPEYLDEDQDNILASKEWFFEDYDNKDNPKACRIYTFKGDALAEQDAIKGSCFEE